MHDLFYYSLAAFFEIFGCFAFWKYFKENKSATWLIPGTVALLIFGYILTKVESEYAGKAYAIYGGIYIAASLLWLVVIEKQTPDIWDFIGAFVSIIGACIIIFAPR